MTQTPAQTLSELKPGDEVTRLYWAGPGGLKPVEICKVLKVTAKQIVIDKGGRYYREDGRPVGGGDRRIKPTTEAHRAAIRQIEEEREQRHKEAQAYSRQKELRLVEYLAETVSRIHASSVREAIPILRACCEQWASGGVPDRNRAPETRETRTLDSESRGA